MPFKQVGSANPRYLAATDILIGDMSNTNYEFLLYDRPVILLANKWVRDNFPDIGVKTDLNGLREIIERSLKNPDEFKSQRKYWLEKTIYKPDGLSSKRYIGIILSKCQIESPDFIFIHGNNTVRKTNLKPLIIRAKRRGIKTEYVAAVQNNSEKDGTVYVAAHYRDLMHISKGYKVHIDHDLKGKATSNLEKAVSDYKEHNCVPMIDLHITAGKAGEEYTKLVLGPHADRVVIGGYPKGDDLIKLNTQENKMAVYQELGFDISQPLITYAPAGIVSYAKPGGSLCPEVIKELKRIASESNYNILAKLKYPKQPFITGAIKKVKRLIRERKSY